MIGLRLLAVLGLAVINGFFAAAEFSLVAVRVSRVRQLVELGDPRARIVQQLLGQLDRVVSGVQVGITLTSLGIGALGESTVADLVRPMVNWLPGSRVAIVAHGVALAVAFAFLTTLHVVIGELVPKTVSLERAERAALLIARPFHWYLNFFQWAIVLLEGFSRHIVRALGVSPRLVGHTVVNSAEELQIQVRQAREHGLLAPDEESVILGAMELAEIRVREIMVPRPDVHALRVDATLEQSLTLFAATRRSRLPVFHGTLDHLLGYVHVKDMLWALMERDRRIKEGAGPTPFDLRRLLRELLIVPESKLAGELISEMRGRRVGMAMVVDEFGSILGVVTMEDLLEQMVGEIHDEFDVVEVPEIVGSGSDRALVFDGAIALRDLETQYDVKLPEDPAYNTLGGFIFAHLGFIPRGGESFEQSGYRLTVLEMERRRVARVKIQRLPTRPSLGPTVSVATSEANPRREASQPDATPPAGPDTSEQLFGKK